MATTTVNLTGVQPTLVSGTNIKTINSTSLLGLGDIAISDATISTTDITTNNFTTAKHGFVPKGTNVGNFLKDDGTWASAGGGLTIGTTAIASGTVGRILFEGAGNVVQEDSTLFWDNTNKRLGVGATPDASVRLDVRAQGALSTDIALRVRNSANTMDSFHVSGDRAYFNGITNGGWNPIFAVYKNSAEQISVDEYGTRLRGNVYTDTLNGHNTSPILVASQSGGGNFLYLQPNNGGISLGFNSVAARLDILAQGALSSDIALRVRNSANTADLFSVNGLGRVGIGVAVPAYKLDVSGSVNIPTGSTNQYRQEGVNVIHLELGTDIFLANTIGGNVAGSSIAVQRQTVYGYSAGASNTGANQIAFGYSAGASNTGTNQIAIGYNAGVSNTGTRQTAIGESSGRQNTGADNSNFGYNAGYYVTGVTVNTGSSQSVFIGSSTQAGIASQVNQIVIGYNAIGLGSNKTVIGNSSTTLFKLWGAGALGNIATPATIVDHSHIYSADIVAGNAAPHFRTENGAVIKLYQETTAVLASTFAANTSLIANDTATFDGYTIGQVVKALRSLGILA